MEAAAARDRVAERVAETLIEGFDRHYRLFRETSAQAKERFERAAWAEAQQAVPQRVRYYDSRVEEYADRLRAELSAEPLDDATWQQVKLRFIGLLHEHKRPELAETFFNSVVTRVLDRTYAHNDFIFVRASASTEYIPSDPPNYRSYYPRELGVQATLVQVFRDFGWTLPFGDLERDAGYVSRALLERLGRRTSSSAPHQQVQVLSSPFYRNKAAYVIGNFVDGHEETPFAVPVLHDEAGALVLDTVLLDREQLSVLFSLSRAYFMVDMDVPSGYVQFLQGILPRKPRSELYTALGLGGQGKTLFFRDLLHHLHHSEDLFVEAPGTRGQVMHVFNLPSYPYVFKVIKDVFGPGKRSDRATVRQKFRMLKEVDRVGRMTDVLEFVDLVLPAARFAPELLEQLDELAPSTIAFDGEGILVRHCYVERRLIPLNIHLAEATPEQLDAAVREYGNAIRELAIANVFAGDLLWRNFGLNRHGRVEFYDYDEIEYLTDCVFRSIPPAPTPEAELSDETWYPVGPSDVFPEEFATFLLASPPLRDSFLSHHEELLRPEFWQDCQRRVAAGEIVDFFPYPESSRFCNRYDAGTPQGAT